MFPTYGAEIAEKTAKLISEKFHVEPKFAQLLAIHVLDAIDSHGGSTKDWEEISRTVDVVVKSWIDKGYFKNE